MARVTDWYEAARFQEYPTVPARLYSIGRSREGVTLLLHREDTGLELRLELSEEDLRAVERQIRRDG